ncbi:hypothetical protein FRC08_001778 [Ceratobasidium sp. 394]|nr:hypothetical protein FRC08_001778 [Ceratobasidium sp. 394]KAG9089732.1 hypothetical protein FS749_001100 [Ceratobasidium sp. UAMH 11750]
MKFSFALVALFAGYVATADLSFCVEWCAMGAAEESHCGDHLSKPCVCDSDAFNEAATICIVNRCSISDQDAALNFKNELCGTQPPPAECHVITNVSSRICPLLLEAPKFGDGCKLLLVFTGSPNESILI